MGIWVTNIDRNFVLTFLLCFLCKGRTISDEFDRIMTVFTLQIAFVLKNCVCFEQTLSYAELVLMKREVSCNANTRTESAYDD